MSKARELASLGNAYSDGALSNRNLIINGAMQVAQRGTSATGVTGNGYYVCDRFTQEFEASGTWTLTQSTDAPSGFRNSAKWECTASTAQGITTYALVEQRLEKQNLAHLQYGTAGAKDVTLSFWVKSNKTGDYNCNILVENNTNPDKLIASKYTIISANTWEYKTITFEGDTSLDLLIEESNNHFQIEWWLGGGTTFKGSSGIGLGWQDKDNTKRANETVNLADTIGNYWQITGVQLEVGDTATPFEHRSYGQELALAQRFFCTSGGTQVVPQFTGYEDDFFVEGVGAVYTNDLAYSNRINWPVPMRARPTVTIVSNSLCSAANQAVVYSRNGGWNTCDVTTPNAGTTGMMIDLRDNGGFVNRDSCMYFVGYYADAEL